MTEKIRLDQWLVQHQFFLSRSQARDAILRGLVSHEGKILRKPSLLIAHNFDIQIQHETKQYVSRAALKLRAAIEYFHPPIEQGYFLDIGASTGGFSQVLLEFGARKIIAIDVGHDQFHHSLRQDPRIQLLEGVNARYLNTEHVPEKVDGLVADVSFISLKLVLPPVLNFVKAGGFAILLIKPQFEGGRDALGKNGIVRSLDIAQQIAKDLGQWLETQSNWQTIDIIASPLKGKDGNQEFLLYGKKND